ncbi:MAG: hypothetical protein K6G22_06940 [Lachnospiraceae bacterium]|nr:hypothetical protein [Lachnospiraceae bacterium]
MMRIVVNDIAASKGGAMSVLKDFYGYLRDNEKDHEWIFLLSDAHVEETDRIKVIVCDKVKKSRAERLKFDLLNGKKLIESLRPDVFFSMQNTLINGLSCKKVLYVHQPLGFQDVKNFSLLKPSEREYAIYQHIISRLVYSSVKKADRTIVQTEWMKDAVVRKTKVSKERVIKILPDVADLETDAREGFEDSSHFFYPASDILYKNHSLLVSASDILRKRGITDHKIYLTLTPKQFESRFPGRDHNDLVLLGQIDRDQVIKNYKEMILVFPSYIETFGYPLMEARVVKGRILAPDLDYSKEVLSGYGKAYYFDPFDPVSLADLMEKSIRGELKEEPVTDTYPSDTAAAKRNSWEEVVKELTCW